MADQTVPPDKPLPKAYKCHPSTKANFVVCIVCEDVYHLSDFNRLKKVKFLSNIFAICDAHGDLTSKVTNCQLDDQTKSLIAEIKQNEVKRAQEKLQAEIENSLSMSKNTSHNATILSEDDPDFRAIVTENTLLKQLNKELESKNDLLLNTIDLMKNVKPTYADIISKKSNKQSKIPDIKIIQKDEKITDDKVTTEVSEIIKNEIILPIEKVIKTKNKGTIVKCTNKDDVSTTCDILKNKLGNDFEVSVDKPANPKIKVFGFTSIFKNTEELEQDLNQRNFYQFDNKCKVIHYFKYSKNKQGALIELSSDLYEYLRENKFKIYIGYQCCKVFDAISISLCFKCSGYNHSSKKCTNEVKCAFCAGNHLSTECSSSKIKQVSCANCSYANQNYGKSYNIHHCAGDTQSCEILKKKIEIMIANTDYVTKPSIPEFIGPKAPSGNLMGNTTNRLSTSTVDNEGTPTLQQQNRNSSNK